MQILKKRLEAEGFSFLLTEFLFQSVMSFSRSFSPIYGGGLWQMTYLLIQMLKKRAVRYVFFSDA